jgi:hypothetical protein
LDRRLGGPQSQSGRFVEEKILDHYRNTNTDPSVIQLVGSSYTDYAIPAPQLCKVEKSIVLKSQIDSQLWKTKKLRWIL